MKDIKQEQRMFWDVLVGMVPTAGSLAGNLASEWMWSASEKSVHKLSWTGTPVSAIAVALSMDGSNIDETLTAADFFDPVAPAGAPGSWVFEIDSPLKYRKIIVTRTSGTGTMTGMSQVVE